ncbi:MAG TPA: 50S ribosomal protein L35 [Patescibacteria group bacterium]|nr:50S ribosomal protein L35 [Patescibacteria group bacterium]
MPKLKTNKAIKKRIKVTKSGKLTIRTGGQDHFNAKESGKVTRAKRRDKTLSKNNRRNVKRLLPYS